MPHLDPEVEADAAWTGTNAETTHGGHDRHQPLLISSPDVRRASADHHRQRQQRDSELCTPAAGSSASVPVAFFVRAAELFTTLEADGDQAFVVAEDWTTDGDLIATIDPGPSRKATVAGQRRPRR